MKSRASSGWGFLAELAALAALSALGGCSARGLGVVEGAGPQPEGAVIRGEGGRGGRVVYEAPPGGRGGFKGEVTLYDRSLAVVIGIDDYEVARPKLTGAVRDARAVAQGLEAHGFEVTLLVNEDATRLKIVDLLTVAFRQKVSKGDRVLIYFAGHGTTLGQGSTEMGYLMPVEGRMESAAATGISMQELQSWLSGYDSDHVMLVADACYSGLAIPDHLTRSASLDKLKDYYRTVASKPVRMSMVAGSRDEQAFDNYKGHGLFTFYFLAALERDRDLNGDSAITGADLDRDGLITGDELAAFIKPNVMKTAASLQHTQNPQVGRRGDGEYFFLGSASAGMDPQPEAEPGTEPQSEPEPQPEPEPEQRGKKAVLTIRSEPSGLEVWLDGKSRGRAPLESLVVDVGSRRLEIRDKCQVAEAQQIKLGAGEQKTVTLKARPREGTLKVQVFDPKGNEVAAEVFVDGAKLGQSLKSFKLPVCSKQLEVVHGTHGKLQSALALKEDRSAELVLRFDAIKPSPGGDGFVLIEKGTFKMGSPGVEVGRFADEKEHGVKLTRSFYIQEHEVTQRRWRDVLKRKGGREPSYFSGCDDCPVEQVNWFEALAFANALSESEGLEQCYTLVGCKGTLGGGCQGDVWGCEGDYDCQDVKYAGEGCKGYRLPTEAEWEYAARGKTTGAIYSGTLAILGDASDSRNAPALDPIAWYGGNSETSHAKGVDCSGWSNKQYASSKCGTQRVGQKGANGWGAHDMLGNVYEWVWDAWEKDLGSGTVQNPRQDGAIEGVSRVYRGGGWNSVARGCRAALRDGDAAPWRDRSLGFRLVRSYD